MANKKSPQKKKTVQTNHVVKPVEEKKGLLTEAKEPSAKELLFVRIGMISVSAVVLVFIAFLIINQFVNNDEVPYEDYVTITHSSLNEIVKDNGDSTYGDFSYFNGMDSYANLASLINKNDVIYFYFYHSSDYDTDVEAAITSKTVLNLIPTETLMNDNEDELFVAFILIDLDEAANGALLTDTTLDYLGLADIDGTDNIQALVTFDIYNPDGETFTTVYDQADILDIINNF